MNTTKLLPILLACMALLACHKSGEIRVQNNISQVKITDVRWGKVALDYDLLPGETSPKIRVDRYDYELPASHRISFTMSANNKSVFLQTSEEFLLNEDDDILIVLSDETKVTTLNK